MAVVNSRRSFDMTTEPNFIERDLSAIKSRMAADSGIQPTDPEYVVLEQIAYEMYVLRCNVQDACKQNLLDYARYPMLDYLGALRNCARNTGESDDEYRIRIKAAMNAYTVCGTEAAYRYLGKNANDLIIDVNPYSVLRADQTPAGIVQVYVLTTDHWTAEDYEEATGDDRAAMKAVLDDVAAALSPEDRRPMGEEVQVFYPDKKETSFTVSITATRSAPADLAAQIQSALNSYLMTIKNKISKDIVIAQVIGICQSFSGCYKAVTSLSADFTADYNEFIDATCTVAVTSVTAERE